MPRGRVTQRQGNEWPRPLRLVIGFSGKRGNPEISVGSGKKLRLAAMARFFGRRKGAAKLLHSRVTQQPGQFVWLSVSLLLKSILTANLPFRPTAVRYRTYVRTLYSTYLCTLRTEYPYVLRTVHSYVDDPAVATSMTIT